MIGLLRLHAPSLVLTGWSVWFLIDGHGRVVMMAALITIAVAVCIHTRELIRLYRRHHDG